MAFPPNRPRNDTQIIRGPQGVPGKDADPLDLIAGIADGQVPARLDGELVGVDIVTPDDLAAVGDTANNAIPLDQKNVAGGVAALDGSGHIADSAVPPSVVSKVPVAATIDSRDARGNITSITEGGVVTAYTWWLGDATIPDDSVKTETTLGKTKTYVYTAGVMTGWTVD